MIEQVQYIHKHILSLLRTAGKNIDQVMILVPTYTIQRSQDQTQFNIHQSAQSYLVTNDNLTPQTITATNIKKRLPKKLTHMKDLIFSFKIPKISTLATHDDKFNVQCLQHNFVTYTICHDVKLVHIQKLTSHYSKTNICKISHYERCVKVQHQYCLPQS